MGLRRNRELRKLEKRIELLEFLKTEFGIESKDLHYLHEAIEYVKKLKENGITTSNAKTPSEEDKKNIKDRNEKNMTPEQFINQFAGEVEEFYPYGKPKTNNN